MGRAYPFLAALILAWLAACGDPSPGRTENAGIDQNALARVQPDDFALSGCANVVSGPPCAIVQAGGKTLIFGAPEGSAGALEAIGVPVPDAVFLFSHRGEGMEGLMRLRNQSWQAGREARLGLVGPEGTSELTQALERALARSDAIVWTETPPAGGYDIAPFMARQVAPGQVAKVFDTGDLQVTASPAGPADLVYLVRYGGLTLKLSPCVKGADQPSGAADRHVACETAGDDLHWPLPVHAITLNSD